jgi:hypothetical protein
MGDVQNTDTANLPPGHHYGVQRATPLDSAICFSEIVRVLSDAGATSAEAVITVTGNTAEVTSSVTNCFFQLRKVKL